MYAPLYVFRSILNLWVNLLNWFPLWFEATEEEVKDHMKGIKNKRSPQKKVAAAAKTKASAPAKQNAPASSPVRPSPNPAPTKRCRGKQTAEEPDPADVIKELREAINLVHANPCLCLQFVCAILHQLIVLASLDVHMLAQHAQSYSFGQANKKMQAEMAKLRAAEAAKESAAAKQQSSFKTPPSKVSAPTPVGSPEKPAKPVAKAKAKASAKAAVVPPPEGPPPMTEAAKHNRLRRLCEVKPSGRCNVPAAVHQKWAKSTREEKEAMIEELEKVNWNKDIPYHDLTSCFC